MTSIDPPGLIDAGVSYPLEVLQDEMTQGVGEELISMEPTELRRAINDYLDRGVDFVKYGGTNHKGTPALITFSPRAQEAIVEEVHRRGKIVETHCTSPEGIRISLEAGIDLVQHPEALDAPMSQELVELHKQREVTCSMNLGAITGEVWLDYQDMVAELERSRPMPDRPLTGLEARIRRYWHHREWWRANAEKLVERLGTDGIAASVADDLDAAVAEADIVSCATISVVPGYGSPVFWFQ